MSWYEPNPAPGLPITSTWGNAVENACQPAFATLASLQTTWTDAPDGASAFVLADRHTYRRRGGAWLLELQNVQGVVAGGPFQVPDAVGLATSPLPAGTQVGESSAAGLRGRRIYHVSFRGRIQVVDVNPALSSSWYVGVQLNAKGTLNDAAQTQTGGNAAYANSQRVMLDTYPLGWDLAVRQGSSTGIIVTGGADDQVLSVNVQVVAENPAGYQFNYSALYLSYVDVGPA